jgi:hypothetical protein
MNVSPAKEASETERKLACGWFEGSTIRMGPSTSGSTLIPSLSLNGGRTNAASIEPSCNEAMSLAVLLYSGKSNTFG